MSLKIVMGNMFSGKTTELIRILKRYSVIGKSILVINSLKDVRSPDEVLKTHDDVKFNCKKTNNLMDIDLGNSEVVAVDEAQFFTHLKEFCEKALDMGKIIILAGLDGDYLQRKFGEITECIPLADEVTKLSAICMCCMDGTPGPFTKRIINNNQLELIGGNDMYQAVCRKHLSP